MAKKKLENIEVIKKPKAISPFDIIKMMFTDVASFNNLSNLILSKNFFMINRIFSIIFPMQAQCFNNLDINQAEVIRAWQRFATTKLGYGRVPGFVYTKGAKASQEQNKTDDISKEDKELYCKHYEISLKDTNSKAEKLYILNNGLPKTIVAGKSVLALNMGNEIQIVSSNGWLKKKYSSNKQITNIVLGDSIAGVVYKNKIEILDF